jgi:hypothetical protein
MAQLAYITAVMAKVRSGPFAEVQRCSLPGPAYPRKTTYEGPTRSSRLGPEPEMP